MKRALRSSGVVRSKRISIPLSGLNLADNRPFEKRLSANSQVFRENECTACRREGPSRSTATPRFRMVDILLVEDHTDTRVALSKLLTRAGHEVLSAQRVSESVQLLDDIRFDVLLCDIDLEDGTGLEVVKKAKLRQPGAMTVALTAFGAAEDMARGVAAGFDHYLVKPMDVRHLSKLLADAGRAKETAAAERVDLIG